MKTENGKIIEATRDELYHMWITGDWDEFMPFEEYMWRKIQQGVKIIGGKVDAAENSSVSS